MKKMMCWREDLPDQTIETGAEATNESTIANAAAPKA
jgi:hypothetical protein